MLQARITHVVPCSVYGLYCVHDILCCIHTNCIVYVWNYALCWMRENIYIYIRWFVTNLQETPWVDAKRNKVLLVSSADLPCWYGRNIVWNMERDQSFWITSSEHQGTMPKRIFSFSCSMQVIQFADLQFHLIK